MADLPILRRFPALAAIPHVTLCQYPTPIHRIALWDGRALLLKRDDRTAAPLGGNKVRALEWLLGSVKPGDNILTIGSRGSTHALATATYARRLGARATIVRWNQQMNPAALLVDSRIRQEATVIDARWPPAAYGVATSLRIASGARWIPAGGASAVAILGHVNAALELAEQVDRGECELPERIVVPLGTGGTAAGLALGLRLAGINARIIAVRVVPRLVGNAARVQRLARACGELIERTTGERLPRLGRDLVTVEHGYFGGGYGQPLATNGTERALDDLGVTLDDTYSRKAFAAAIGDTSQSILLWLTFDGRLMRADPEHSG